MLLKLKLYELYDDTKEHLGGVLIKDVQWKWSNVEPAVGMTIIVPQMIGSFRFYLTHIVADLRNSTMVFVEKRLIPKSENAIIQIMRLKDELQSEGWESIE